MTKENKEHLTSHISLLRLYVDGAARGNPGPAGVGIFIKEDDRMILEEKEYIGEKTNNEAEYIALILGLQRARTFGRKVKAVSDSELLVNQIQGTYKVKQLHLKSLLEKAKERIRTFEFFEISHSLRDDNKEADRLANEAIDEFITGKRSEYKLDYHRQEKLF